MLRSIWALPSWFKEKGNSVQKSCFWTNHTIFLLCAPAAKAKLVNDACSILKAENKGVGAPPTVQVVCTCLFAKKFMPGAYAKMARNTGTTYWRVLHYICIVYVCYGTGAAAARYTRSGATVPRFVSQGWCLDQGRSYGGSRWASPAPEFWGSKRKQNTLCLFSHTPPGFDNLPTALPLERIQLWPSRAVARKGGGDARGAIPPDFSDKGRKTQDKWSIY